MFNKSYNIAAAERANHDNKSAMMKLNVKLPDESTETFNISITALGQVLLDSVCDCVEIFERDYFGLLFNSVDSKTNTTVQRWLKMDKMVRKQIQDEKNLQFRMRFVPGDLSQMSEAYTRYQLFLQIKHDLLANRLNCPRDMAIKMAAYALQSELGDYNPQTMKSGYVSDFRFVHDQNVIFDGEVAAYHESLKGQRPEDAELNYLTVARSLPYYGCDQYSAELLDKKCQFGLCAQGIIVQQPNENTYIIPWLTLEKVLVKGKTFVVKVLINQPIYAMQDSGPDFSLHQARQIDTTQLHQKQGSTLKFVFPCSLSAKEAWSACIETHSFFRVRNPKSLSSSKIGRSSSFFKFSFFSGRRTLPELLDIRRRNRTIERSFVRTPSKRYNRRTTHPNDKVQAAVRGSVMSHGSSNRQKKQSVDVVKPNTTKSSSPNYTKKTETINLENEKEDSDSDEDDYEEDDDDFDNDKKPKQGFIRPNHTITQSVRVSKTGSNSRMTPFQKSSVTHTSLPRAARKSSNQDETSDKTPESMTRSFTKEKTKINSSQRSGKINDLKNPNRGPITSNPSLVQSAERMALLDPDSVVNLEIRAQDGKYGFLIRGGLTDNSNYPVIVTKVTKGSAADKCTPKLCEGDQIIRINNKIADQCNIDEIKDIIRFAGQKKDGTGILSLSVKPRLYFADSSDESLDDATDSPNIAVSPKPPPIPPKASLSDLKAEMKILDDGLKSGNALQEFERLYKQKQGLSMSEAKKQENLSKNRYKDILPYDQTRVNIRNGDYINANFIKMDLPHQIKHVYIAAQGPLRHTACDFMQMVLEHRVGVVVMLTELSERGRVKCYKYWPNVGESMRVSTVTAPSSTSSSQSNTNSQPTLLVTCDSETIRDNAYIRELRVRRYVPGETLLNSQTAHKFIQLQYMNWPDHDVPKEMPEFFKFMNMMRQYRANLKNISQPVLVHCSAGIGRTGVVITMDLAMNYLDNRVPFSVLTLVKEIRSQRAMLIQSHKQYEFLCRAILNYFSSNTKL